MIKDYIKNEIGKSVNIKTEILEDIELIQQAAEICIKCLGNKNKILLAGNRCSAADAQHITGELLSKFYFDRAGLNAITLTTDSLAIANDYAYEKMFGKEF